MVTVTEMSIGDMFDKTFKLIGKTFSRNIVIGVVVFIPVILALMFALDHFIQAAITIAKTVEHGHPDPWPIVKALVGPGILMMAVVLLFSLGNLLVTLSMMNVLGAEVLGEPRDWMEALGSMAALPLLRAIGASILQGLAIMAIITVPVLIMVSGMTWLIVLGVFLIFGGIGFAIYLGISWSMIVPILAVERDSMLHAFTRSMYLVRGHWWRTLGVLILFGMASQMAVSLLSTPLSFVLLWGFWSKYFTLMVSSGSGDIDPDMIFQMFSGIGLGYAGIIGITTLLTVLLQSAYMVVVYFDLRARKGEFRAVPTESPADDPMPESPAPDVDLNSLFPTDPDQPVQPG